MGESKGNSNGRKQCSGEDFGFFSLLLYLYYSTYFTVISFCMGKKALLLLIIIYLHVLTTDIHGEFHDLPELFRIGGKVSDL